MRNVILQALIAPQGSSSGKDFASTLLAEAVLLQQQYGMELDTEIHLLVLLPVSLRQSLSQRDLDVAAQLVADGFPSIERVILNELKDDRISSQDYILDWFEFYLQSDEFGEYMRRRNFFQVSAEMGSIILLATAVSPEAARNPALIVAMKSEIAAAMGSDIEITVHGCVSDLLNRSIDG